MKSIFRIEKCHFYEKKSYSVTYQKIILEEQSVSVTGTLF